MIYGYIRVSTDKQTTENQRFEILKYADEKKLPIDTWMEETISATKKLSHRKLGALLAAKVFHMCWTSQRARPNSYRFMKSPITRSCICSVLEKHRVRRTSRFIRVRRLMCLLSIFCVFSLPT